MSQAFNADGVFVPIREDRRVSGGSQLNAPAAEVIIPLDGDASLLLQLQGVGSVSGTVEFAAAVDDSNFLPITAFTWAQVGGTALMPNSGLVAETYSAVGSLLRVFAFNVSGFKKFRVRTTALSSGAISVTANASGNQSPHHAARVGNATAVATTSTAAVGLGANITIAAVPNMRIYLQEVRIIRFAAALLTAGATPVLVPIAGLAVNPIFSLPAEALPAGAATEHALNFGDYGAQGSAINTVLSITAPVVTNVIWRLQARYRLAAN